ncbi:MAG: LCP family protein [Propionibacteriaceae bacterium]|nr:LCP family protein [Propionibacteriaceae bacterium]
MALPLMALVLPGSAQLAAGSRRLGKWAMRLLIPFEVIVLVLLLLFLLNRSWLLSLGTSPFVLSIATNMTWLTVIKWLIAVPLVCWGLLILDAWRLASPGKMTWPGRIITGVISLVLAFAFFWVSWFVFSTISTTTKTVETVFTGTGPLEVKAERYNILLIGADADADRVGIRPDTTIVASVAADTGRTILFSIPRNMQRLPFPKDSPLYKEYPDGFYCYDTRPTDPCMTNSIYTEAVNYAKKHKNAWPDDVDPGIEATRGAIAETLGLDIPYYAMVDIQGFEQLIDALGGVYITVNVEIGIGYSSKPSAWIKPGKNKHMNGYKALWFARSRTVRVNGEKGGSDYGRMERQKCLLNAIAKQLDPATVLANFNAIAEAGQHNVKMNLPAEGIPQLLETAQKAKELPIESVNFMPPLIPKTYDPDFKKIRKIVKDTIAKSEAIDHPTATPTPTDSAGTATVTEPVASEAATTAAEPSPTSTKKKKSTPSPSSSTVTQTDDLSKVCS